MHRVRVTNRLLVRVFMRLSPAHAASARLILLTCYLWSSASSFQLFIYGLGNIGRAVANQVPSDWEVRGTTRQSPQLDDPIAVPFSDAHLYLTDATHILITIPPDGSFAILNDLASSDLFSRNCCWIGFVSTTGVYGNHDGAWVTEESQLLCGAESSARDYVQFEMDLKTLETTSLSEVDSFNNNRKTAVFRCAGLYGPQRSALHTLWKQGLRQEDNAIIACTKGKLFVTNRIHECDVARAIVSAMRQNLGGIYNLADDEPEARSVVMDYAAELLKSKGMSPPERSLLPVRTAGAPTELSSKRAARRQKESKLVDNSKMKAELIEDLLHPTYREGLNAIVADVRNPWWDDLGGNEMS
jgi:nucleoside-diphosphate-sugar epimerase